MYFPLFHLESSVVLWSHASAVLPAPTCIYTPLIHPLASQ
uniref:Uncharacterized protein n=1 Tax=Anguilla anguilla TaxID=7936 RepID=A0A0E9SFK9_ANGAN